MKGMKESEIKLALSHVQVLNTAPTINHSGVSFTIPFNEKKNIYI